MQSIDPWVNSEVHLGWLLDEETIIGARTDLLNWKKKDRQLSRKYANKSQGDIADIRLDQTILFGNIELFWENEQISKLILRKKRSAINEMITKRTIRKNIKIRRFVREKKLEQWSKVMMEPSL